MDPPIESRLLVEAQPRQACVPLTNTMKDGAIALVQRGACNFTQKVTTAAAVRGFAFFWNAEDMQISRVMDVVRLQRCGSYSLVKDQIARRGLIACEGGIEKGQVDRSISVDLSSKVLPKVEALCYGYRLVQLFPYGLTCSSESLLGVVSCTSASKLAS